MGHCIVFLGKTPHFHSSSLHPGIQMGTGKLSVRADIMLGGGGEKEKNLWWGGEINNILHATETGWMGHLAWVQTLPTYPYIYFLIDISLPPRISSPYLSKNCRASLYFAPLSLSPSGLNHSRLRKLPVNSATEEKNMYFNVNKI